MSDEREIDFGQEDENESGLHPAQGLHHFPPLGSQLWRIRMGRAEGELERIQHETDETCKAINWALDKIFQKEPPF